MILKIKKLRFGWFQWIIILSILASCRSNKDLSFIRDTWPSKKLPGIPQAHSEYKIKANDNLFVSIVSANLQMNEIYDPSNTGNNRSATNVWQTLPGQFLYGSLVDSDGAVSLPALGKMQVIGLSLEECEAKIKTKAEEYLKDVTVKVRLLSYKVTVMGEVKNPGVYYNYNPEFTVFDALGSAGGLTEAARLDNALVLRRTEDGSKTITLNLNEQSSLASEAYFLEPNDVVVIAPARYRNAQLGLPFYTTMLSTLTTFVLVLNFLNK